MDTQKANHLPRNFANLTQDEEGKLLINGIIGESGMLLLAFRQVLTADGMYEIREKAGDKLVAYKKAGGELLFPGEAELPRTYGGGREPFKKRLYY